MKKVIAVITERNNKQVVTSEATANKTNLHITFNVDVTLEKSNPHVPDYDFAHPRPNMLMYGPTGQVYRIAQLKPVHTCYACFKHGTNFVLNKFYCKKHFDELVITKPIVSPRTIPGRNKPCHCGSKRKYKHCCLAKDRHSKRHYFNSPYVQPN